MASSSSLMTIAPSRLLQDRHSALQQTVDGALATAETWFVDLARRRCETLDRLGQALALVALSSIYRARHWGGDSEALTTIASLCASASGSAPQGSEELGTGSVALSAMMGAVALPAPMTEPSRSFVVLARRHWGEAVEAGCKLDRASVWTGHLLEAMLEAKGDAISEASRFDAQMSLVDATSGYEIRAEEIRDWLARLAVRTGFGRRRDCLEPEELCALEARLPLLTFWALKRGDLDLLCPLVRGLHAGGFHDIPEYVDGLLEIASSATLQGAFALQELTLDWVRSPESRVGLEREVLLPLTAASAWTLCECLYPDRSPFSGAWLS